MSGSIIESGLGLGLGLGSSSASGRVRASNSKSPSTPPPSSSSPANVVGGGNVEPAGSSEAPEWLRLESRANREKNETEPGGRFRPFLEITGVCPRCKDQIDWKRRYGKYQPLTEPAKWPITIFALEHKVCAKCSCREEQIVGRDVEEVESEKRALDETIKNARERERRTLLRAMNKNNSSGAVRVPPVGDRSREGELFSSSTIDEYAEISSHAEEDSDENEDEHHVCD